MENKTTSTPVLRPIHDTDVTTLELPDGAIGRLGRGVICDISISSQKRIFALATHIGTWVYELDTMQPIALLDNERGMVNTVTLSHDEQWLATHNSDGIIKVHETQTRQCVAKIKGWYRGTSRLAFSPDNKYIAASGYGYGDVYVWCTRTGAHVASFKMERKPKEDEQLSVHYPLCFSPNGQLLAYASGRFTLTVRNVETKERIASMFTTAHLSCYGYVYGLSFSPCNQFIAASIRDPNTRKNIEVQVWNIDKETLETTYTDYGGTRVIPAYTSEGTLRVADVYKDRVVMWNVSHKEKLDIIEYQAYPEAACFSTNGQQFAITSDQEIRIWGTDSMKIISFPEPTSPTDSMFFSQSDNILVCKYWRKSNIVFWDVDQKQVISSPIKAICNGKKCALSPCEELLAIIGENKQTLEVWNTTTGTQIAELTEHRSLITTVVFSPSGEHLVSGDVDRKLTVWSVQRWEKQHSLIANGRGIAIKSASFHPSGKQFVTSVRTGPVDLWDVESGEHLGSPSVDFTLADASLYKGDVREIQRRYKQKSKMRWLDSVKFSPCGTLIAGGLWGEIRLWDAATLEPCMGMILPESCYRVGVVAFSPCGEYLASGSWWNDTEKVSIRIWKVATGENIHTFWGHSSDVQNLTFSKDGELLASSSYEGTILLWDMKPFINS
ncbi:WD40 repeat domain-containing protein [Candidatus Poribacteria bacterium]|nr:WD40 repeat domain-containing protein [Candidatus Poribacteria bacterium]